MLLELKNIFKSFDTPVKNKSLTILDDLNFTIDAGETAAIVGPSGSGKSTLLNIIGTLDKPDKGEVLLNGTDLLNCSQDKIAQIRNKEIGFIFQLHHLLPQCTVLENVLIPTIADQTNNKNENPVERAKHLLNKVGLAERTDYFPGHLSGGELQRVAVVRALINQPKLILADEPTGSLDNKTAIELAELLKKIDMSVSIIMVTHSSEIAGMMDMTYNLHNGKLTRGR